LQVCALLTGGGYAEKVVVPAGQLLPVPEGVSLRDAAGGESFLVRTALFMFSTAASKRTQ
jgi:NADPH:quinone reductase-like Zn-dependent oxidoreductase